ncbi:DUF4019 domain-containing protein [Undibacterium oligocarboniphilum]|uniref:DUF4019 domain-containing protein n=1 Tax=Undibacterium oligocarboniphilum TaxID=666702 RepID=A0A850QC78_9BURK|nr:DUF4019 domain-containing protein [Undibacterium oligocarboniphilum]MBC3868968.1 DUF4019 domain-containing protein [Undibacterium oligocarboniphilum]NVO76948.1 DUF4019 domain-containing protein [Undibacterium oligocarboniphilum]
MKLLAIFTLIAGMFTHLLANAGETGTAGQIPQAQAIASQWLALLDKDQFTESWKQSATLLQQSVPQHQWQEAMNNIRTSLGTVMSRQLKSAEARSSLPGAPDGEYVVIQYETRYTNKAAAIETITPMKEKDGTWHVAGYYIR